MEGSIHRAAWPSARDFEDVPAPEDPDSFDLATRAITAIRKHKATAQVSLGTAVTDLVLAADEASAAGFERVAGDVLDAARADGVRIEVQPDAAPGTFEVANATLEQKA